MKKTEYKHHYITFFFSLICLVLLVSSVAYIIGSWQFFKTHFNSNVTINGVDVGRLSEEKAYDAANANGNNWAVLRDNNVHVSHFNQRSDFVTRKDVHRYWLQQYKPLGSNKKWDFAPHDLSEDLKALNRLKAEKVKYRLHGHTYTFRANDLFDVVHYSKGKYYFDDDSNFNHVFNDINNKEATLNKSYEFLTPDGRTITVKNRTYGWRVNKALAERDLKQAFQNHSNYVDGRNEVQGTGYNSKGTGYNETANHGLGNNYILVSIKDQKLWVYKNNQPVVTLDIVTGTPNVQDHNATPTGVWYVMLKQSPSVIQNKTSHGTVYSRKVQYWVPITQNGCGFDDAPWRTNWDKNAYLQNDTHGRIEIKQNEIQQFWDNVSPNEPVIIY